MQRIGIDTYDLATMTAWSKNGVLSPAVLKAFQDLAQRRAAIAEVERQVADLDRQLQVNTSEQSRISGTMQNLPREGELYADYTKELKDLNTNLRSLRTARKTEGDKLEALRRGLNEFLGALTVE